MSSDVIAHDGMLLSTVSGLSSESIFSFGRKIERALVTTILTAYHLSGWGQRNHVMRECSVHMLCEPLASIHVAV